LLTGWRRHFFVYTIPVYEEKSQNTNNKNQRKNTNSKSQDPNSKHWNLVFVFWNLICLPIVPLLDRKGSTGKPLLKTFYNRSRKAIVKSETNMQNESGSRLCRVYKILVMGESRERLVFHPCIIWMRVISDPPAKYRSTASIITPPAARIIIL
jgi:hypothetical protein